MSNRVSNTGSLEAPSTPLEVKEEDASLTNGVTSRVIRKLRQPKKRMLATFLSTIVLLASASVAIWYVMADPENASVPRITGEEFSRLYGQCVLHTGPCGRRLVVVDVRSTDAFSQGHIQGALSLPEPEFEKSIVQLPSQLPKDATIVLYCQ